jgi:uncharacterized protein
MKKIAIGLVDFYKAFLAVGFKSIIGSQDVCRFSETCSDYTKRMIGEKGAIKGVVLGVVRLFKCQPFAYNV